MRRDHVEVGSMTKNRNNARKTKKIIRTPATRFAHLNKRMKKRRIREAAPKKTS
jgi:hypothetical protein